MVIWVFTREGFTHRLKELEPHVDHNDQQHRKVQLCYLWSEWSRSEIYTSYLILLGSFHVVYLT